MTGVDLSPEMVKAARAKGGNPTYVVADIVDYAAEHSGEPYDAVVFNACFGNRSVPAALPRTLLDMALGAGLLTPAFGGARPRHRGVERQQV